MQVIHDPREMNQVAQAWRCGGRQMGFVPTMGALHAGHMELCRRAREGNDGYSTSIFVNPTQFGPHDDLARYPRPLDQDLDLLREAGCAAVFTPAPEVMYPARNHHAHGTWVDVSPLNEMWEGVTRPGHLRGVTTVVTKLFNIVAPQRAYFGEKDYQQLRVVQTLTSDLNFSTEIVPVPTLREPDGLAMSSRNAYLNPQERQAAAAIFRAMRTAAQLAAAGETDCLALGRSMNAVFEAEPLIRPQYAAIVEANSLTPLQRLTQAPARLLVAAHVGTVRLIDNMEIRLGG